MNVEDNYNRGSVLILFNNTLSEHKHNSEIYLNNFSLMVLMFSGNTFIHAI